jgi:cytochrome c-type biogenesis protein CcmH/NrfG
MIGGLTYGAKKDTALKLYDSALKLAPDSAIARIEYANGLVLLEGKKALARAEKLYAEAAAREPIDAMERLDVELARAELED